MVMKILAINPISFKKKNDWITIWLSFHSSLFSASVYRFYAYLHHFFLMASQSLQKFSRSGLYFLPLFCQSHSCHILDYAKKWEFWEGKSGTWTGLPEKTVQASLIRNTIKFLPWQIGHMGTIHGFYSNFDGLSISLSISASSPRSFATGNDMFRNDKRHLGDLV